MTDPVLDGAISLVVPFIAFVAAEEIHASGVIAVVVAGLLPRAQGAAHPVAAGPDRRAPELADDRVPAGEHRLPAHRAAGLVDHRRRVGRATSAAPGSWRSAPPRSPPASCCGSPGSSRPATSSSGRRPDAHGHRPPWTFTFLLGWAGMRGVVTLAAAFVIEPDTEYREVLLLIALTVVAGTLFIQGMTLPLIARRLKVPGPDPAEDALARATLLQQASKAAMKELEKQEYEDRHGVIDLITQRLEQRNFAAWERLGHRRGTGVAERPVQPDPPGDDPGRARAGARDPRRRLGAVRGGRGRARDARHRGVDARPRRRGPARRPARDVRAAYGRLVRRPRGVPGESRPSRTRSARPASTTGSTGSRCASASSAARSAAATRRRSGTRPRTSTRRRTRSWSPPSPARTGAGATCTTRLADTPAKLRPGTHDGLLAPLRGLRRPSWPPGRSRGALAALAILASVAALPRSLEVICRLASLAFRGLAVLATRL